MLPITMPRRRILAATGIVAVAVLFVVYGPHRSGSTGNSKPAAAVTNGLEVELVTLRPAGFEPSEIIRPKGSFVLFIDDRSGKENSSLVLRRVKGERLRALNLNRKKSESHAVLDLPPGTYVLQDAGDSELHCQITILP
jgi:hypothetical protein